MTDREIIAAAVAMLQEELGADLVGVLAGGSRLRGEGDATSDIDMCVVVGRPRRRRRNVVIGGVEVELFYNPAFQVRRYFAACRASGRGNDQHLWAKSTIVFDRDGVMAELQAEAAAEWAAGPPPLDEHARWLARYGMADLLRDVEDVVERDGGRAALLLGGFVLEALRVHHRVQRRWIPKPKRMLLELASWDPVAATLARRVCDGAMSDRHQAARELAAHVLAPLGGPMPLAWEIAWEELDE